MTSQTQGRHSNNSIPALSYRETHGEQGHILGLYLFCFFLLLFLLSHMLVIYLLPHLSRLFTELKESSSFFITIRYLDCVGGAG